MSSSDAWSLTVQPRPWQLEALQRWEVSRRGIAAVVTGAGKTVLAEMCMQSFVSKLPDARIIVVVPTIALLDQWYVSLREDLTVPDADIATFSGRARDAPSRVNILVINTAREVAPSLVAGTNSFLIVDECHRAASPVNSLVLNGDYQATLGISATPEREYDSGFEEVLIPALGPVIFRYDYPDAVSDGVIVPFDLINVAIPLLAAERSEYDRLTKRIAVLIRRARRGDDVDNALKRALRQRAAVSANASFRIPTAVKLVEQSKGVRTLVFHERIAAAEAILAALRAKGISATIYHSKISEPVRRDNLRMFRRGLFDVLVTCRALDEGTNVPETAVGVIASSTATKRQRIQRMGRVLRPALGKSNAKIFTIYATDVEEERLAREVLSLAGEQVVTWQRASVN